MLFPDCAWSIVASGSFVGERHETCSRGSKLGGLSRELLSQNPGYFSVDPFVWFADLLESRVPEQTPYYRVTAMPNDP